MRILFHLVTIIADIIGNHTYCNFGLKFITILKFNETEFIKDKLDLGNKEATVALGM